MVQKVFLHQTLNNHKNVYAFVGIYWLDHIYIFSLWRKKRSISSFSGLRICCFWNAKILFVRGQLESVTWAIEHWGKGENILQQLLLPLQVGDKIFIHELEHLLKDTLLYFESLKGLALVSCQMELKVPWCLQIQVFSVKSIWRYADWIVWNVEIRDSTCVDMDFRV